MNPVSSVMPRLRSCASLAKPVLVHALRAAALVFALAVSWSLAMGLLHAVGLISLSTVVSVVAGFVVVCAVVAVGSGLLHRTMNKACDVPRGA